MAFTVKAAARTSGLDLAFPVLLTVVTSAEAFTRCR